MTAAKYVWSAGWILCAITLILAVDFVFFARHAQRETHPSPQNLAGAQAVVALTGQNGLRIAHAVAVGRAHRLPIFVSGVHPDLSLADISGMSGVEKAFLKCCVQMGRLAKNTAENGAEVAQWAQTGKYSVIVLVTSSYHMRRAMIELGRAMPETRLIPLPVPTPFLQSPAWWRDSNALSAMLAEWAKQKISALRATLL